MRFWSNKNIAKNSVAQNNKQLEEKARRVLRACYKAATTHAPKFDTLLVRLANVKEANAEAKGLYNAGLRVLDPICKRLELNELLGNYYSAQERRKAAKSRSEYARTWLQNAERFLLTKKCFFSMLVFFSLALRAVPVFFSLALRAAAGLHASLRCR